MPPPSDVIVHPERFDPEREPRKLIAAEHRLRYLWASQVAAGKDVLDAGCGLGYGAGILAAAEASRVCGVDADPEAIEEARQRVPELAEALSRGDIRELRFDDRSFDLVVCFETIEHVEEPDRALFELRRVLRPDGLLLVSSPNPDVYPAGNGHHVREYRPSELAGAVAEHFRNVGSYSQAAWLTSGIEPAPDEGEERRNGSGHRVRAWSADPLEAGREAFTIVAATDGSLPRLASCVALAGAFEVDWWSEQVAAADRDSKGTVAAVERDARLALAQASEREADLGKRLEKTSRALLDANQELAQIPLLKHRLAELHEEHAHLWARFGEIEGSRSWRTTAPLRRLGAFFGLGGRR
jgi:2-polyprenyl-3-methyl-5-hydroxy-6-metoxy-1,4-benzoquinol methylase